MSKNLLADWLKPYSDEEVAYRLGIKWWRQVASWRDGKHFPQRRLWPQLASILKRTSKQIEAAYADHRNGDARRLCGCGRARMNSKSDCCWICSDERRGADPLRRRQTRAYQVVIRALKSGRLTKATSCDRCGEKTPDLEGHHEDYSRPLEIMWLCTPCHCVMDPHHPGSRALKAVAGQ